MLVWVVVGIDLFNPLSQRSEVSALPGGYMDALRIAGLVWPEAVNEGCPAVPILPDSPR
jgi:hypothetical protein